ncbi:OmpA family protein [Rhodanobacter sp. Col0626]|uniref:OmpA family protein n=1 Tax=Rhodanobacter sp. Col0626 TaxID=3415679 RepID=UPI003CE949A9
MMQTMKWRNLTWPVVLASVVLAAGCSTVGHDARPADGDGTTDVSFPDPSHATMPEGIFVNIENLRKIAPGMTKAQLRDLLGAPHFNEGVLGVHTWNYIFDFRKGDGDYFSCQYQVQFDRNKQAESFHWKPESCKSVLDRNEPVAKVPAPVALPKEPIRLSSDALFDFDSANLKSEGRDNLSHVLQQIRSASGVQDILIVGYTDRIGSDAYNQKLSRERADAVRKYLADGDVPVNAMQIEGRGEADPLVQCKDESSRTALIDCLAPNRRVEFSGTARP